MKQSSIKDRSRSAVNLAQYNNLNNYDKLSKLKLEPPVDEQFILRMLIKRPFGEFKLPNELKWVHQMLMHACAHQQYELNIHQPFCYITIRHGIVNTTTDDEWHVDGFSMNITHLPEQNYIWCNNNPTQVAIKPFNIPYDFNHREHNLQLFLQDNIDNNSDVSSLDTETIYCLDPYIAHRRPVITESIHRTFIRISFTPIEIEDVNNTLNPLLETNYIRDGVKEFRNKLERYKK